MFPPLKQKIKEEISEIKVDQYILFIPRLHLIDNQYITISKLIKSTRLLLR
jgi:hypothetical protein